MKNPRWRLRRGRLPDTRTITEVEVAGLSAATEVGCAGFRVKFCVGLFVILNFGTEVLIVAANMH